MRGKILEIENLTVSFDGFKALDNLNFSMDAGELRVVIGPNGAGKTTFLDAITGKVQPTTGRVLFKGRDLRAVPEYAIARSGIGRKFQTPRVYLDLTVRENLDLATNTDKNVFATLFGRPTPADSRRVNGLLETVGLVAKADLGASLLSHGEKQRLEIGMLVAQSPDLLLVDEPVAGLTDEETENVGSLLLSLAASHSIIVIEHDMEFVRQIAETVTVLHQGSVLCEGTMDRVREDPRVIEVYLGRGPGLTPRQMSILRAAASIVLSGEDLAAGEREARLTRLSEAFADDPREREQVREELQDYPSPAVDGDSLLAGITDVEDKEEVAKLCREAIADRCGERPPTGT